MINSIIDAFSMFIVDISPQKRIKFVRILYNTNTRKRTNEEIFLFQQLAKVCLCIKFDAFALKRKKMPAALPTVTVQNGNGASVALPEVFTSPIRPYVSSEIVFFMVASYSAVCCCVK